MPLSPGFRLGHYEILAAIGAGGMGEVYRARDVHLGRDVAIKLLPESVVSSPERLARFEREARTVAGLNHPNIVVLYSVEEDGSTRFLTMELVDGRTLGELIAPGGLPLRQVLDLATKLADALAAAHEKGIVHRDLKPANVMVTQEGRLKVLDFGLAKLTGGESNHEPTSRTTIERPISTPGVVVGTVAYMAPEQIRGEAVDARADLFALGIVLYELLSGHRPFSGPTIMAIGAAILNEDPEPLARARPDLPYELEQIVSRCLEKNPQERTLTALEVASELRRIQSLLEREESPAPENVASIAVLPFVNRSRDEEDEYFSDGLADELLNMLGKIRGLRVAARTSSFQFKGTKDDLGTVGRKLKVATLLEGSVRKVGARVRIAVQLVKVADGYHLWSETYDRMLDDVLAVQDDIAQSVVKELRATLLGGGTDSNTSSDIKAEVARAARGRSLNAEAHRLALQGRHLIERLTKEDILRGAAHLREALRLDPNHALAWVDLSRAHLNAGGHGMEPMTEAVMAARGAANRALAIEPDLPEAHAVLGRLRLYFDWDWEGAQESYRRAMELAPGIAVGRHGAGVLAQNEGRLEEALDLYRRAVDQDPLSGAAYHRLGIACLAGGRFSEAEEAFRKSVELAPQRVRAHSALALALLAQGRLDEAHREAEREGEKDYRLQILAIIYHAQGKSADSDRALQDLIEDASAHGAFQIAEAHAARGEVDAAFEWLDRAYHQRDPGLVEVQGSYPLSPLHTDPRWAALLEKMRFRR